MANDRFGSTGVWIPDDWEDERIVIEKMRALMGISKRDTRKFHHFVESPRTFGN